MSSALAQSVDKINYELKVEGFSVLDPSLYRFNQLQSISERFEKSSCQDFNNPYKANIFKEKHLNDVNNSDLNKYNTFCLGMISLMRHKQNNLDAIFQTYDTPASRHIAQDPHFDRIHTLKFMLYVNDLMSKNGAFCLSRGSHIWTKEKFGSPSTRPLHGAKGFLEDTRSIPDPILSRLQPIEGLAGTIIIFDTDCIHHQGIVTTGEAHIIRSHYRERGNQKKIISKLHVVEKMIRNSVDKLTKQNPNQ